MSGMAPPPTDLLPQPQPVVPPARKASYKSSTFKCRQCGTEEIGRVAPAGWYLLRRAAADMGELLHLGAYCTLPCLMSDQRRLEEKAAVHGGRLGLPEDDLTHRRKQLENALGLMHQGLTIRQAGDIAEIKTATLRNWLSSASIAIDSNGRLLGAVTPGQSQKQSPAPIKSFKSSHTGGNSPISAVNELEQIRMLLDLRWVPARTGPAHDPRFTMTVTAVRADTNTRIQATGTAARKADAKAQAAEALLNELHRDEQSPESP